jgi:hypothetical protein
MIEPESAHRPALKQKSRQASYPAALVSTLFGFPVARTQEVELAAFSELDFANDVSPLDEVDDAEAEFDPLLPLSVDDGADSDDAGTSVESLLVPFLA